MKDIKKRIKAYCAIFKDAQEKMKKEADIVMYIVEFFKDILGYDVFNEISKEYQVKDKYCDIAIKLGSEVAFLIEVKQPGIRLIDKHIEQAENYAMRSGTKWVILTNGCEWRLYHLSFDEEEGIVSSLVFKIDFIKEFVEKPDEVIEKILYLHKKHYLKGELEKYWKKETMLVPTSIVKALFSIKSLKAISREINKGAKVKVGVDDIAKAIKNLMDKEVLAELADIKIRKKRKQTKPRIEEKIEIKPDQEERSMIDTSLASPGIDKSKPNLH